MAHPRAELFANLPAPWPNDLMPAIREAVAARGAKIVILDDDPTGTQTVHDVSVLTVWDAASLADALQDPAPAVFILTNTRSLNAEAATHRTREIATHLQAASHQTGRDFVLISRGDSTLRGHFPDETRTLAAAIQQPVDGELLIPAFMAGGRFTLDAVHYVAEGEMLVPVGQTPFAQDSAFGFRASDLRDYIAEKSGGAVDRAGVSHISLATIRTGGPDAVQAQLQSLRNGAYAVVDTLTERDLEVVALAAIRAEADGHNLLYRTAASFAAIRAGVALRPLLTADELHTERTGGTLLIVGSYVPKTSAQLAHLLEHTAINRAEVQVPRLLDDATRSDEIARVTAFARPLLKAGQDVVVYTSRDLITGGDAAASLNIGARISESLVTMARGLHTAARVVVAKGGITSSDIATEALGVRRAQVMGQILPGVPVWGLPNGPIYVVFPGNVGADDALTQVVRRLQP